MTRRVRSNHKQSLGHYVKRRILLQAFVALSCTSAAINAAPHPEGGDGQGLFIKLEVPWTTFKIGEEFVFRYTLQNASDKPVPVAIPVADMGLGNLTGGQPFLEAICRGGRRADFRGYDVRKASWPPRTNVEEEPQTWAWLPPGEKLTWNQNNIWPDHYGVGCYQSFEGFQGYWLVGPNRWISSDPVKIEIVSVPMPQWTEVFKVHWTSYSYGKDQREATVYRIPIKGKMYLFFDGATRITEVESNDQFEYEIDKDGTNLEITIKNARGSRKIYFHLRQGYTRDIPWPIGSVRLFNPKPEPIPSAELEALRKVAFPAAQAPPAGRLPDKKTGPAAPSGGSSPGVADAGKGVWFWTVIGFVVFMLSMGFLVVWKLRQRASINRNSNGDVQP